MKTSQDFPLVCKICKVVLCNDEDGDIDQVYSENYSGWLCESCIDDIYWCDECKDYADELVDGSNGLMCAGCDDALSMADTRDRATAELWFGNHLKK